MSRACSLGLGLAALLASFAVVHGEEAKNPRTDLYGDPLPPGAVMRLGTIRLRHADADVAFSKDGKQLISCGVDGDVCFWDVATGRLLQRRRLKAAAGEEIEKTAVSANGARAATRSLETVRWYDTRTGQEIGRLSTKISTGSLTFSPNGRFLALQIDDGQNERTLQVVSVDHFKRSRTFGRITSSPMVFTVDGKRLAGIGTDEKLHVWDTISGAEIITSKDRREAREQSLAFSPDGKMLALGSKSEGKVRLLDAATLKTKVVLKAPASVKAHSIDWLVFAAEGRYLAGAYSEDSSAASPEYGVLIWDVRGVKPTRRIPERYDTRMVFAPNGKTLACHDETRGEIRLWDVDSGRSLHRWPVHGSCVEALTISTDGKVLVSSDNTARLCLWNVASGKLQHALEGRDDWISGQFCLLPPDGKRLVYASFIGAFGVRDVAAGKELRRWQIDPHLLGRVGVHAVGVSADGKRVAAVAWVERLESAQLFVWDVNTGKRLSHRPYHREMRQRLDWRAQRRSTLFCTSDVAFAPDGESVTVWLGNRVGLEEVSTGSLLALLPEDVGGPILFSPDGRLLAAAILERSKDPFAQALDEWDVRGVSLIETASGEEVLRLNSPDFKYAAFTPDSRALLVTDFNKSHGRQTGTNKLRVWDTLTGERLHEMAWPQQLMDGRGETKVCSLAVLPDYRAATGMTEGDILLWDLAPAKWPHRKPVPDLDDKKIAVLWSDLAGDARKAHRAIATLAASPTPAVSLLTDRLQPVTFDAKRIAKLVADLDSDSFERREAASAELIRKRYRADTKLQQALANKPSLEMRRRLEAVLAEPKRPPTEALRTLRAIAVLERIGTPEARRILEKLAGGAASPETRAAQQALQRLTHRNAWAKETTSP